jgi:hypothetical protein
MVFHKKSIMNLELVKLDKVWIEAVNEIANELERVEKLQVEELHRSKEIEAEKEKSNFDFGDFE